MTSGTNHTTMWWSQQSGVIQGASSRDSTWNTWKGWDLKSLKLHQVLHGFLPQGHYGTHLNVYDWTTRKLLQKIDLGMEGVMPLEIRLGSAFFLKAALQAITIAGSYTTPRPLLVLLAVLFSQTCSGSSKLTRFPPLQFLHNFKNGKKNILWWCSNCSPSSKILFFNKDNFFVELLTIFNVKGDWDAEKVIDIPNKKVILLKQKCLDFDIICNIRVKLMYICCLGGGVDHAWNARGDDGHLDQHGRQVEIDWQKIVLELAKSGCCWLKIARAGIGLNWSGLVEFLLELVGLGFLDDQRLQVPLLFQLAARRCEAVRHYWHQVL